MVQELTPQKQQNSFEKAQELILLHDENRMEELFKMTLCELSGQDHLPLEQQYAAQAIILITNTAADPKTSQKFLTKIGDALFNFDDACHKQRIPSYPCVAISIGKILREVMD